jgi:hypothetical protein
MYEKLRSMHRILFREPTIAHSDLFQRIEPLVHFYYQNFRQRYPLDMLNAIYHGDWIPMPLESVVSGAAAGSTPVAGVRANPLVRERERERERESDRRRERSWDRRTDKTRERETA